MYVSIIISSYKDELYLRKLLKQINSSNLEKFNYIEVLIGDASEIRSDLDYGSAITNEKIKLRFFHLPKLSRSHTLNFLIKESKGEFIVRLDARTRIRANYFNKLHLLSFSGCANVGGIMQPIGYNREQKAIARTMRSPFAFGWSDHRNAKTIKKTQSIYLGAFTKKLMPEMPWYEDSSYQISEDSLLCKKIIRNGQCNMIDPDIKAYYLARDNQMDLFKLSFGYGVAKMNAIFADKKIINFRFATFLIAFLFTSIVFINSLMNNPLSIKIFITLITFYFFMNFVFSGLISSWKTKFVYRVMFYHTIVHFAYLYGVFHSIYLKVKHGKS